LQRGAGETTEGARDAEADEHVAIDVPAQHREADGRADDVWQRHRRHRELQVVARRDHGGQDAADPESRDRRDGSGRDGRREDDRREWIRG